MMQLHALGFPADLALRGLLLMGRVWLGLRALRRDAAALRHATWTAALVVLLLLPLAALGGGARFVLFETAEHETARPSGDG